MNTATQHQIASYKNQIKNVLSLLKTEYDSLNHSSNTDENISPNEIRKLREISKKLNEYCSDVMAYQEKIRLLNNG
ncbi:hypothetical protein [Bernardetia sp.]|uniref:hypothetical protein n=1 Tax=Bernardetia sp. TaxID=1937974 RepID=UPI0025BEB43F|nr:hypothetical protein [Bernardetia sp.]